MKQGWRIGRDRTAQPAESPLLQTTGPLKEKGRNKRFVAMSSTLRCSIIKHDNAEADSDMVTRTLTENKTYCRHNNGHKSKSEEKSNRDYSHGAEQHHCES